MAKSVFGLDIGSYSVKLVEVDKDDNRFRLKNYAIAELYGDNEEYDIEGPSYSRQSAAVRSCFRQMKLNPRRVRNLNCSIGGKDVAVKQIKSIPLSAEELESSLTFEARKHLPLEDTEAILDYQILSDSTSASEIDILMVATTKKAFDYHIKLLKELGVKPKTLDAECTALVNSYFLSHGKPEGDRALIFLDVGAKFSTLTVFADNGMLFSRDIAIGGHKITDDIRNIQSVEYPAAEEMKRTKGLGAFLSDVSESEASIRIARRKSLDSLVDEIRRSMRYYTKETGIREFEKMLLCGGSALLLNLNSHLAQALSMNIEIYNPFEYFTVPPGFNESLGTQLATACGLAMRED
ncbi:MAG: type IV pilus assembly protein PilM [Candidatus Zixiibacteriota bacterium]|nr:MAG: type IV pilus assembly protein PilM [candidate division Zixibacteria bacterium]